MKNKFGQIFIGALKSYTLTKAEAKIITDLDLGGIILFKRNIKNAEQLLKLTRQIHRLKLSTPPFIAIDAEGGLVHRLSKEYLHLPAAPKLVSACPAERGKKLFKRLQLHATKELVASGINFNFAPLVDILPKSGKSFIAGRTLGQSKNSVIKFSKLLTSIMQRQRLISCAKHFPGHGATTVDSHLALPKINKDLKSLSHLDLAPYRQLIKLKIPTIMTAHILFKKLDKKFPATLSTIILEELLRKKLKFKGLIVSDDLEMKGISKFFPAAQLPSKVLAAGCDLQIFGKGLNSIVRAEQKLAKNIANDPALLVRYQQSLKRIKQLKKRYKLEKFRGNQEQLNKLLKAKKIRDLINTYF